MKIVYSDKHAKHDPQTFFIRGVTQLSAEQSDGRGRPRRHPLPRIACSPVRGIV
jgi:hypothetical protein